MKWMNCTNVNLLLSLNFYVNSKSNIMNMGLLTSFLTYNMTLMEHAKWSETALLRKRCLALSQYKSYEWDFFENMELPQVCICYQLPVEIIFIHQWCISFRSWHKRTSVFTATKIKNITSSEKKEVRTQDTRHNQLFSRLFIT